MDSSRAGYIAENWGIKKQFLRIIYLGVPLGGKPFLNFWDSITEKIQKNLGSWKYSLISKGGKITLINSTLESLSTYQMTLFKAPKGFIKILRRVGVISFGKYTDILSGGLKLLCQKTWEGWASPRNAFLSKWLWKFISNYEALWKRLIFAKYDQAFIGDFPVKGKYGSAKAPWRSIVKMIDWFPN